MRSLEKWRPWLVAGAVLVAIYLTEKSDDVALEGREHPVEGYTKRTFVTTLQPIATAVEKSDGIRAALGITQGAHESAWGNSELALKGNNLFGIVAENTYWITRGLPVYDIWTHEWVKPEHVRPTDVVVSRDQKRNLVYVKRIRKFRKYASWEESYRDWARLIQTPAYVAAGVTAAAKAGVLKTFGEALGRVGYATDPDYPTRIVSVGNEVAALV